MPELVEYVLSQGLQEHFGGVELGQYVQTADGDLDDIEEMIRGRGIATS